MKLAPLLVLLLGVPQEAVDDDQPHPTPRFKHSVRFWDAAVSPDGTILVGIDVAGAIRGWDTRTARLLYGRPVTEGVSGPMRLTCSPDGRFVAISSKDFEPSVVIVLSLATGKEVRRVDRCYSPVFSPDGAILGGSDGDKIRRWSMKSGAELPALEAEGQEFKGTAWSADGVRLAASDALTGDVVVWDVATRRWTTYVDSDHLLWPATALAFSPDGKTLAVGNHWGIRFLNLSGGTAPGYAGNEEYGTGPLQFSSDGRRMMALARRRRLLIWDLASGATVWVWSASHTAYGTVGLSGSGDRVIWFDRDGLRVERIPEMLAGKAQGYVVRHATFSPDGQALTVGDDGEIRLWDPATQKETKRYTLPTQGSKFFFSDGKRAIFGAGSEPVQIWDLTSGKEIVKVRATPSVGSAALSPDSTALALGHTDGSVSVWTVADRQKRFRLRLEMAGICAIAWSPDGKTLAWGDKGGAVATAESASGRDSVLFKPRADAAIQDLCYEPDGKRLQVQNVLGDCWVYTDDLGREPVRLPAKRIHRFFQDFPDNRWIVTGFSQRWRALGVIS